MEYQGHEYSPQIKEAADFVAINKPEIMVFLEAKIKNKNVYKIGRRVWRHADFITNNSTVSEGRILVLWNKDYCDLKIVDFFLSTAHLRVPVKISK